mmetsp:Transcript_115981/g.210997  ORF Transcript_115981/g.210997 Transcript_115981/m.210997 type:complete len:111 (+) Transcript_115981:173-505(+)
MGSVFVRLARAPMPINIHALTLARRTVEAHVRFLPASPRAGQQRVSMESAYVKPVTVPRQAPACRGFLAWNTQSPILRLFLKSSRTYARKIQGARAKLSLADHQEDKLLV